MSEFLQKPKLYAAAAFSVVVECLDIARLRKVITERLDNALTTITQQNTG